MPGPPLLPPKLQVPGGGVVPHCASFGRWLTGTRPPPPELLEEPPLLLLDPPLEPPLEEDEPPDEELEPPLDPPLEEEPPELEELPSSVMPASPLAVKTLPPQAERAESAIAKPRARCIAEPPRAQKSNGGATTQDEGYREVRPGQSVPSQTRGACDVSSRWTR
jgi:hypothetical protein